MSDEQKPQEVETPETEALNPKPRDPDAEETDASVSEDAGEAAVDPLVEEMRDRLMRALADAENTRRRAERDKEDALKYAITRFARDILSVSDNLRRALDSVDDAAKADGGEALAALLSGVSMTERELMNVFSQHGIKQVNPKAGDRFDPNVHQAIAKVPGTGQPNGSVVQVTQTGFTIGGRLLRPAMVLVAKDASGKGGSQEPASDAEA